MHRSLHRDHVRRDLPVPHVVVGQHDHVKTGKGNPRMLHVNRLCLPFAEQANGQGDRHAAPAAGNQEVGPRRSQLQSPQQHASPQAGTEKPATLGEEEVRWHEGDCSRKTACQEARIRVEHARQSLGLVRHPDLPLVRAQQRVSPAPASSGVSPDPIAPTLCRSHVHELVREGQLVARPPLGS